MSNKELVARLHAMGGIGYEAADAIEALEQREAWWREMWALRDRADERAAVLRRLLEVK